MIPPVDPLAGLAVIRRPAEIGGVDIRCQPLLEAMQLVRPDEMHLAGQAGVIAGAAEVVGVGRDVGGEFGRIIIDACPGRQAAGHEGSAAGCAKRAARIGIPEPDGPCRKRFQRRCMQEIRRAVREQGSVQLVDHQDQDIGLLRHGFAPAVSCASI